MFIGHVDHILLTVYSLMEHVACGPVCGWVGRILCSDSCISGSSWFKCLFLSIWFVTVPLCRPLLSCPSRWHGMVCDGWLVNYTTLSCSGGSGLCTSCERVHFFFVLLDPQTKLPVGLPNVWAGAVLAKDTVDQFGLLIFDLVLRVNHKVPSSCEQSTWRDLGVRRTPKLCQ